MEELPDRFVQMLVPKKEEKKEEVAKKDDQAEKKEEKKAEKSKPAAEKKPRDPEAEARAAAERRARLEKAVQSVGVLNVIGARGDGSDAIQDLLGKGNVSGDADKVFAGVSGVGVAGAATADWARPRAAAERDRCAAAVACVRAVPAPSAPASVGASTWCMAP